MESRIDYQSEDRFWRDFLSMASFFSPAINPLQRRLGISSREILRLLGEEFGRRAAEKSASRDLRSFVAELSDMWRELGVGKLEVEETNPLTIVIRDCTICGQIPELGRLFNCAFHEGFLTSALSTKLGRRVSVKQESGYEGMAGTWTRRYITDVHL